MGLRGNENARTFTVIGLCSGAVIAQGPIGRLLGRFGKPFNVIQLTRPTGLDVLTWWHINMIATATSQLNVSLQVKDDPARIPQFRPLGMPVIGWPVALQDGLVVVPVGDGIEAYLVLLHVEKDFHRQSGLTVNAAENHQYSVAKLIGR